MAAPRPWRRQAASTSTAVSTPRSPATEIRPQATVRPSRQMVPNACHGADIISVRAIGGRSWPR